MNYYLTEHDYKDFYKYVKKNLPNILKTNKKHYKQICFILSIIGIAIIIISYILFFIAYINSLCFFIISISSLVFMFFIGFIFDINIDRGETKKSRYNKIKEYLHTNNLKNDIDINYFINNTINKIEKRKSFHLKLFAIIGILSLPVWELFLSGFFEILDYTEFNIDFINFFIFSFLVSIAIALLIFLFLYLFEKYAFNYQNKKMETLTFLSDILPYFLQDNYNNDKNNDKTDKKIKSKHK